MTWQSSPYTIPLVIASILGIIWTLLYGFRNRQWPPARVFALLVLVTASWILADALQLASGNPEAKIFWFRMQVLVSIWVTALWFSLALLFTGRSHWLMNRRWMMLGLVPLITAGIALTDTSGRLLVQDVQFVHDGELIYLSYGYGPALVALTVYTNLLQLAATGMLIQLALRSYQLHWRQIGLIILCYLIVIAAYLFDAGHQTPVIQPRLFSLSLLGLIPICAQLLNHARRADFATVARGLLVTQLLDPVIVLDANDLILDLNPAAQLVFGCSLAETQGFHVTRLDNKLADIVQGLSKAGVQSLQFEAARGMRSRVYDVRGTALTDWRRKTVGRALVLRDITERVQAEKRMEDSLHEKEVLLKEIHHRVKNNLQVISSLLNLQSAKIHDPILKAEFQDSQDRIGSMALVHEQLYRSEDLACIDFGNYLRDLTGALRQTYQRQGQPITVTIKADSVLLDIETAIPCGLVVNELVSNAFKHAFPDGREGAVKVELRQEAGDRVRLMVQDNGVGFPQGLDYRKTSSLGLRLVNNLSRQLGTTVELSSGAGTSIKICFAAKNRTN